MLKGSQGVGEVLKQVRIAAGRRVLGRRSIGQSPRLEKLLEAALRSVLPDKPLEALHIRLLAGQDPELIEPALDLGADGVSVDMVWQALKERREVVCYATQSNISLVASENSSVRPFSSSRRPPMTSSQ